MKFGHIVWVGLAIAAWGLFPGCGKDPALGGENESCQNHLDCVDGLQCLNNVCTTPTPPDLDAGADASLLVVRSQSGESCASRGDCVVGLVCINNVCTKDPESDAGDQTGAGKRGESCQSRGDCVAGLACVSGVCAKADFGIAPVAKECVQIDCMTAKDCCPKVFTDPGTCMSYQTSCEAGSLSSCNYFNMYCKCNEDLYVCTPEHTCKTKVMCTDAPFSCPSQTPICNGGVECVKCLTDQQCLTGQKCTPQHTCLSECLKDGDCQYLWSCSNGQCVDTGCATNRECVANTGNPLSVCAAKKCKIPCQTDAECYLNGRYSFAACVTGFCQDIGCESDEECRNRLRIPVGSNARAICQAKTL